MENESVRERERDKANVAEWQEINEVLESVN